MEGQEQSLAQRLMGIGIKKSHAYMLAAGDRTPSLDLARRIEASLGIPMASWPMPKKHVAA